MKYRAAAMFTVWLVCCHGAQAAEEGVTVERLSWAGIKLVAGDTTVFIDAVGTDIWDGKLAGSPVPVEAATGRRYALVTHAHNDHFDVTTLKRVLGERGYLIAHESMAAYAASRGLQVIPAATYQPVHRGGFIFLAVPAVDGFGEEQFSWIVTSGDRRFLHGGDTLWHGQWRNIGQQYGPFDAVFLPINGARMQGEPMAETPGTMTPAQAADAALQLRARALVPIHFGLNDPPYYTEVEDPLRALQEIAERRGVPVRDLQPGASWIIP